MLQGPEFIMLVGLPGSGKSTIAKHFQIERYRVHSSDEIREELLSDINNQSKNGLVFETLHKRVREDLKEGRKVVYDATNIDYKKRMAVLDIIKDIECDKVCIIVATPYEECIRRNKERDRSIPEEVITRMYKNFYIPQYYEGWDEINIIWDFDKSKFSYIHLLAELCEIDQEHPNHTLTIGKHILKCVHELATILADKHMTIPEETKMLLATALFHDIGKKLCKEYNEKKGHYTYYQHHLVGAYDTMFYLKANGRDTDQQILEICNYIMWHMIEFQLKDADQKTVEKYKSMLGEYVYKNLILLHEADLRSK